MQAEEAQYRLILPISNVLEVIGFPAEGLPCPKKRRGEWRGGLKPREA